MADTHIEVEIGSGEGEQLEVTMRGTPSAIVQTLVSGLSRANLLRIHEALAAELAKRGLPPVTL